MKNLSQIFTTVKNIFTGFSSPPPENKSEMKAFLFETEEQKANRFLERIFSGFGGEWTAKQFDYQTAADEGFGQTVWVNRCIREIAYRVMQVPWGIFKKQSDGSAEEVFGTPLNKLIVSPNPESSFSNFLEWWVIYLYVSGNCFIEKVGNGSQPQELYFLRPDRMTIIPDSNGNLSHYLYQVDGSSSKIDRENIIHFLFPDPNNDYYGISPLFTAGRTIDTETDATKWNRNMLKNDAKPSGIFTVEGKLNAASAAVYQAQLQSMQGPTKAYRPAVLDSNAKFVRLSLTPSEADWINLKKMNREEICGVLGVPPLIIGILDHGTYSNYEVANRIFWDQTIRPILRKFRNQFNREVSSFFGDNVYLDYKTENIEALQENNDLRDDRVRKNYQFGVITLNEARQAIGFDVINDPAGDEFFKNPGQTLNIAQPASSSAKNIDVKVLNLASREEREAYKNSFNERRNSFIAIADKKATKILSSHYRSIAKEIKKTGSGSLNAMVESFKSQMLVDWHGFYNTTYETVIKSFAKFVEVDFMAGLSKKIYIPETYTKAASRFDVWTGEVQNYVEGETAERIVAVSKTTRDQVKKIILQGTNEGWSIRQISDAILELDEIETIYRAGLISATEVSGASNAGSFFSANNIAREFGIDDKITKTWETAGDERVRPSHIAADGQTVPMNDPFHLSGGDLMFPGDSSLGVNVSEIIACRCVPTYNTGDVGGLVNVGSTTETILRPFL